MTPPERIVLGPHTWRILTDDADGHLIHEGDRGRTDANSLTIRVDARTLAEGALRDTVLHECLHACWDTAGLSAHEADAHQEQLITSLVPQLLDLLQRNPDLVAYLTATEHREG